MNDYAIDLICIFSIWPETFCYTLSEAAVSKVPVLAFDIGALGERVREMGNGWLMPYHATENEVLKKIKSIQEDSVEYEKKKKKAEKIKLKTNAQMCREYADIYQAAIMDECKYKRDSIDYAWFVAGSLMQTHADGAYKEMQSRMTEAERQLQEISDSFTYRVALKLANLPIPFRSQMKGMIVRIYRKWKK